MRLPALSVRIGTLALTALVAVALTLLFARGCLPAGGGSVAGDGSVATDASSQRAPEVWTCAMHPSVSLPAPGLCPICGMELILLQEQAGGEGSERVVRLSSEARSLARLRTAEVVRAPAQREVPLIGTVAVDETRVRHIAARFPGRVDRLFADATGIPVDAGDHLALIYSPELVTAQQELLEARAAVATGTPESRMAAADQRLLDSAREKLRLLGLDADQVREIEESGEARELVEVRATVGGTVLAREVSEGQYVSTGTPLFELVDLSRVWVELEAYESDLVWLRPGQAVRFRADALPGAEFEGRLAFLQPTLQSRTRTVKVRVVAENPLGELRPGMYVTAFVLASVGAEGRARSTALAGRYVCPMHPEEVADDHGACPVCGMDLVPAEQLGLAGVGVEPGGPEPLLVPVTAPLLTGRRAVVYVEREDDEGLSYEGREVQLGPRAGASYVVLSGLAEGERVVVEGQFKLDSDLQIRARPSMMSVDSDAGNEERRSVALPPAAREALAASSLTYLAVSEALAGDDDALALQHARELSSAFSALEAADVSELDAASRTAWGAGLREFGPLIEALAGAEEISARREALAPLSAAWIDLLRSTGAPEGPGLEVNFCPMAPGMFGEAGERGAPWIQVGTELRNPYMGERMLECGSALEPIPAKHTGAAPDDHGGHR